MPTKSKTNPHANCGPLALRPKVYILEVFYKDAFPFRARDRGYLYSDLKQVMKHIAFLAKVIANQNTQKSPGEKRKNVVLGFELEERLPSMPLAKLYGQPLGSPLSKFHQPETLHDIPVGYVSYESPQTKPAAMTAKKKANP